MTRCRTEIRTYHLPDDERMCYVLSYSHGYRHPVTLLKRYIHTHYDECFDFETKGVWLDNNWFI